MAAISDIMVYLSFPSLFLPLILLVMLRITRQWLTNRRKKSLPIPPGPKPWPLVGSFPEIARGKPAFRWIHNFMDEMNTEIACIRLGGTYVIPVTSPELAREFLKKQDSVFSSRPVCMSAHLISNGYLSSIFLPTGDQWAKMRRVLHSHVLSPASLHWLHDKRVEEANNLVKCIYDRCKISGTGGMYVVNVRTVTRQYCGNVITKMVFNKRLFGNGMEKEEEEEEEVLKALFELLQALYGSGISDYIPWLSIFDMGGHKSTIKKALSVMRKHLDTEVDKRIQMWKDGIKTVEQDILDVLLMLKDNAGTPLLSDAEIKTQVLEFMLATMDNPSNAVEWALAEMINQPNLLEKAMKEIDSVVGRERVVEESDLPNLNYVKACIKEAFRLHPVAAFNIPHVAVADTAVGGYSIPKGSQVLLSRLGLGRNARAWEEPLMFKPERHLKEDGGEVNLNDSELKMLAFSTGIRGCPGVKLGTLMTTMLMARLLQGFTWNLPPTLRCISLTETKHDLFLETPLLTLVQPRLPENLYL